MLPEPPLPPYPRASVRRQEAKGVAPTKGYADSQVNLIDIMFLEYMPRGSLDKAIKTASDKEMAFPNRALWQMFHCRKSCPSFSHGAKFNLELRPVEFVRFRGLRQANAAFLVSRQSLYWHGVPPRQIQKV